MVGVQIGRVRIGPDEPLAFIAGPCVLEERERTLEIARALAEIAAKNNLPLVFKASFDKANRTSGTSPRGPGLAKGLALLAEVKSATGLPLVTDIHAPEQAAPVAEVVDMLQIPAMLSRQSDLLVAAGETNLPVMIKKMQLMAGEDMRHCAEKILSTGNKQILLCERGTTFGYHNLVVDMRALEVMRQLGYPVVFDATHSVQQPGAAGDKSGGDSRLVPFLARAASATGAISALFFEVHTNPAEALSDGPNMLDIPTFTHASEVCKALHKMVRGYLK